MYTVTTVASVRENAKKAGMARPARFRATGILRLALGVILLTGAATSAQNNKGSFTDRLLLDINGQALIPSEQPTGIGAGAGLGYAFRDFNLFLRGAGMIAEPGANQKTLTTPTVRVEARIGIMPSFITLLPYVDLGSISTRIRLPNNLGESGNTTAFYAEAGVGAEILMTHEISIIPRLGVAHALVYSGIDSNNFSGPTVSVGLRYTFGRSRALDY